MSSKLEVYCCTIERPHVDRFTIFAKSKPDATRFLKHLYGRRQYKIVAVEKVQEAEHAA